MKKNILLIIIFIVCCSTIWIVYELFFRTINIPFGYNIESVTMRRISFGSDSTKQKKYLMSIKVTDCNVKSMHYPIRHYFDGIQDSVKNISVIDINNKDITNAFDCVLVGWNCWMHSEEEYELLFKEKYDWGNIPNLEFILNNINSDLDNFNDTKLNGSQWIHLIYTTDSKTIPKELTFELNRKKIKSKIIR